MGHRRAIVLRILALVLAMLAALPACAEGDPSTLSWQYNNIPAPAAAPRVVAPAKTYKPRSRYKPAKVTYPEDWTLGLILPDITVAVPATPDRARPGIAVIGDSLADALYLGFDADPALKAEWSIRHRTVSASGLVRDDFHDWPKTLKAFLAENSELLAVVIVLGLNDRQPIRVGEVNLEPLSEAWREAYRKRIDAMIAVAQAARVPLLWVGTPVMRSPKLSADLAILNDLVRERVTATGEGFLDVIDSFADQSGGFTLTGPDIMGDQVRLRGPDGIHFSPAGQRKLAFFVEKALRLRIGDRARPPEPPAEPASPPAEAVVVAPRLDEVVLPITAPEPLLLPKPRAEIGEVRSLAPPGAASTLLGRQLEGLQDLVTRDLFDRGLSPLPRAGRSDDFRWR